MDDLQFAAFGGFAAAVVAMLLVTQSKHPVTWSAWLVPAIAVIPLAGLTLFAMVEEGPAAFWPVVTDSAWGIHVWYDRLMSMTAAFFLLQNRARAAGMKSEVWVLLVIFTGSLGLLPMLARTLYLERQQRIQLSTSSADDTAPDSKASLERPAR